ncbi:MAG: YqeG family HAD IIIA-type phosphatase [Armatimonadota bacterium]|nr:YqeG family HAD IIIA-type phosphatase [Armatimonadota bacterium]MDR7439174.1 YqeG family HAD IIIA-type phosphatase [Armatimonadota bacterium]MDR7563807.1 YqeG family HAD IIIA-type phosphatase [Armatimonadota bacterium]MDR7567786.1 YqeG family HAD IIIA-type phosphatase [Armatimonadota bacterium]MDR7600883.1 YqeG family HAD IIIA-type phosphatase [Armatimonadota bacterium]
MIRWLVPRQVVRRVTEVKPGELIVLGIRGLVLDLDNTLLSPSEEEPPEEVMRWLEGLHRAGLRAVLVSNAPPSRVRWVCSRLGCPAVGGFPKPNPIRLRRAMGVLGTTPPQTAAIGDQLFTDILPANLLGLYTILVDPIHPGEFLTTRLLRWVERMVGRDRMASGV